ncbi:MAG TPA: hypothetical protein VFD36_26015 [Kofleriaceae bacterium]|nr:hypothetical protein [Kofleriaceae bacterium]
MRVIVLLLAAVIMTGAMTQGACASPDVVSAVDPASDVDTPVVPEPAVMSAPVPQRPVRIEATQAPALGRMHAVLVFRPPRLVASR